MNGFKPYYGIEPFTFNFLISIDVYFFQIFYQDDTLGDDDNNTLEEGNNQVDIEPKDTEDDEDDEEEVDETTNVRRKHNKRNPEAEQEAKLKAIARRKKRYNIQFTFDADVRCAITIYYFCTEEITAQVRLFSQVT